jgi:osmotically-inducible protein OsmY
MKIRLFIRSTGIIALAGMFLATPMFARQDPQAAPDNTKMNKDQNPPTADAQKMNSSDRAITQNIRKAIHQDNTLSTYAHNIKIITQDGKVTLRGPVRSEDEKANIQAKAVEVAGEQNVTNQLEVMPAK